MKNNSLHEPLKTLPERGLALIEILGAVATLFAIALALVDITTVLSGYMENVSVCRAAARMASLGPPDAIEHGSPYARMAEVINNAASSNTGVIQIQKQFLMAEHIQGPLPAQSSGGTVNGEVTLITTVVIAPPVCTELFRMKPLTFLCKQSDPYLWTMSKAYLTSCHSEDQ